MRTRSFVNPVLIVILMTLILSACTAERTWSPYMELDDPDSEMLVLEDLPATTEWEEKNNTYHEPGSCKKRTVVFKAANARWIGNTVSLCVDPVGAEISAPSTDNWGFSNLVWEEIPLSQFGLADIGESSKMWKTVAADKGIIKTNILMLVFHQNNAIVELSILADMLEDAPDIELIHQLGQAIASRLPEPPAK